MSHLCRGPAPAPAAETKEAAGCLVARTFLDLHCYNLDDFADKAQTTPGSTQLMYMFYSRLYEKLIGKQKAVEVPLFRPIAHSQRHLGFRELLDWAFDFKICPQRLTRRELERIYASVHEGSPDMPHSKKFDSKITYMEFLNALILCADVGEPMDRSRVDGSIVAADDRLTRVKKLASFLSLDNAKKVRLDLHNLWRDVHFPRLCGEEFEKEARAVELRSKPKQEVETVHPARLVSPTRDAAVSKYIQQFTWTAVDGLWEEYKSPILDMGISVLSGQTKRFRVVVQNRDFSLAKIAVHAEDCGPLRIPWRDKALGPGQSAEIIVEFVPLECGEWRGRILVTATMVGAGIEELAVPTYCRVVQPEDDLAKVAAQLPSNASRPFRPGSANRRVTLKSEDSTFQQLRSMTPGHSRPSSATSSRPLSAASGAGSKGALFLRMSHETPLEYEGGNNSVRRSDDRDSRISPAANPSPFCANSARGRPRPPLPRRRHQRSQSSPWQPKPASSPQGTMSK